MQTTIRDAHPDDADIIAAFNNAMAEETEGRSLDQGLLGQGVFSALYRHVESLAMTESHVCGIRLYVEKDNKRAQQTYDALGMVETDYRIMEVMLDRTRYPGDQEC